MESERTIKDEPCVPYVLHFCFACCVLHGYRCHRKRQTPLYWGEAEWRREILWLNACGINTVEFATMLEFNRIPSTPIEKQKIADRLKILEMVHKLGMRFGYILTNTVVSTVPQDEEPSHQGKNRAITLCPQEPENFKRTVDLQTWYMNTYAKADFFEMFAADWGGCGCGRCGTTDYLRYVRVFAEKLQKLNPKSRLYANTWCIAYWRKQPFPDGCSIAGKTYHTSWAWPIRFHPMATSNSVKIFPQ